LMYPVQRRIISPLVRCEVACAPIKDILTTKITGNIQMVKKTFWDKT